MTPKVLWEEVHQPPLAAVTYTIHLFHLRRMPEELAWTEDIPVLARLASILFT